MNDPHRIARAAGYELFRRLDRERDPKPDDLTVYDEDRRTLLARLERERYGPKDLR